MKNMNWLSINLKRRTFLLLVLLLVGGMASAQVTIRGNVYGGGKGTREDEKRALVKGNTSVTMNGGTVEQSMYGGGELGSVGTFTEFTSVEYGSGLTVDVPTKCQPNTGLSKVVLNGGQVGSFKHAVMPTPGWDTWEDSYGYIFAGGRGEADSANYYKSIAMAVVGTTYLEINDGAFITASVYGGCENGLLLGNSHVKIKGGQIGVGYYEDADGQHWDSLSVYTEAQWTAAINAIRSGTSAEIAQSTLPFHECAAWPFGNDNNQYLVYDIYAGDPNYPNEPNLVGGSLNASDGNTFFGKVYGGGSGYYPIAPGVWRLSAGRVNGNTLVEIEGGHVLTAVFGGNELTDVLGSCTVKMTGGTVGVPQLVDEINKLPLNSHIFGSGWGDLRTYFNQWTNAANTYVYITGGTVFGSVFGGGQDGHVLGDVCVTVKDSIAGNNVVSTPLIGTWGYTSVDGNVFGGGRGYSGNALTAGSVGGNTEVNIEGGTMLGSVYGGGRLSSIGAYFVAPDHVNYGKLKEDDANGTYGYTTVNIKGGTIGNRFEIESDDFGNTISGNVFGGSKGRMTLLDGTTNPLWEDLAKVKQTLVNINEATGKTIVIKGHVFGGGEIGRVEKNTMVDIDKGNIGYDYVVSGNHIRMGGDVYGGGMGLVTEEKTGWVKGNTNVDMSGGFVQRSLYGGGKYGSVGTFSEYYEQATGVHIVGEPKKCEPRTGMAKVVISGGQVGFAQTLMPAPGTSTYDDDFGYVFCGSRGEADSVTYNRANFLAVVDSTHLEISNNALITASAYGGCENGLVIHDTYVKIAGGQIGTGHYKNSNNVDQWDDPYDEQDWLDAIAAVNSGVAADINSSAANFHPCASWPFGNANGQYLVYDIYANDPNFPTGHDFEGSSFDGASDGNTFFGKVYGGGSGYYPMAPGVWRRSAGRVNGNTLVEIDGGHILTAVFGGNEVTDVLGTCTVKMSNGTVGIPRTYNDIVNTPTTGHIFGSGMGDTRAYFNQWTNADSVNVYITGGTVFGSVFGGGQDGHVLRNTVITVKDSIDGTTILSSPLVGTWGNTSFDGNVFGGGRGFSGNALTAGSVGGNTEVNIAGGTMLGSVYGGGRLASVGTRFENLEIEDPNNPGQMILNPYYGQFQENNGTVTYGYTTVNVTGGTIGNLHETASIDQHFIGGNVYGGSKGNLYKMDGQTMNPRWPSLAKVKQTFVNIDGSDVVIKGDVFGGGEYGTVRDSTQAIVSNGTLMRDLFGGGYGSTSTATVEGCDSTNMTPVMIAGRVYGRTNATVNGGLVKHNVYGGGEYAKVGIDVNQVTTIRESTVSLNGGVIGSHDDEGNLFGGMVYGGGVGILADTTVAMVLGNIYIYDTIPNNTENPAHVLGNIHGGSEKALVQKDTHLTLGSVKVGTLADNTLTVKKHLPNSTTEVTLYETRALEGGRVFGGGQGVEDLDYRHAALVMGNTYTEITGTAKVYGSVYGGGELASIGSGRLQLDNDKNTGSATVTISGGTIGPLNGSQHNGNVFGGGKGLEEMTTLNDVYYATVDSTHVVIKAGANIAGSVFGGGANGSVFGNASTDIQGGTIGTTGLTNWDGNVFGAGRNFNAYANTTAAVFGNVDIQMSGGTIMANMYGGGRFGSVGMNYNDEHEIDTITGKDHGYVNINITGGTIGDDYVQYLGTYNPNDELDDMPRTGFVFGGGRGIMDTDKIDKLGNVKGTTVTVGGDALVKSSVYGGSERGIIYKNTLVKMTGNAKVGEPSETMALHRGNVYGGGCGYDSIAQGSTFVFLPEAGSVKGNTRIEMDGSKVYGNIYGACRLTDVVGHATVIISGGEVGWQRTATQIEAKPDFGYVYAAGRGELQNRFKTWTTVASTYAEVSGTAKIWSNLNGGGEEGHVIGNTHVIVKGGTIGTVGTTGHDGNVFGGGRGKNPHITGLGAAAVSGNTQVDIQDGRIWGSVFGGGNLGSVGVSFIETEDYQIGDTIIGTDHGYTLVNVSGGHIGHEDSGGRTGGNVYGGCHGAVANPNIDPIPSQMSHVKQTEVNIFEAEGKQTFIMGSVFGGGEDGHVFKDTYVNVSDGQIGGSTYNPSSPTLCSDRYHGNVYGGGRGLDTYTSGGQVHYSTTAGMVYGNTNVMITGGYITRNVYGGGNMSSVGVATEQPDNQGHYHTGLAKVTITDGTVGVNPSAGTANGMVFGSGHGKVGEQYKDFSMVKNTEVVITGKAQIKGSVFGSGEDGHTRLRTNVLVGDATVDGTFYDGKDLIIGVTGATGVDGNVYGGGRGYDTDDAGNYSSTAGIVGISTTTLINDGKVLGSVFGGGRMASVGYEHVLDTTDMGVIIFDNIPGDYGNATVTVTGTATIGSSTSELENGNVFGSGKGSMGSTYANLSYVHETEVLVNGNAKVYGSVFGGGEDGHVRACLVSDYPEDTIKPGNTHVTIAESATIGDEDEQTSAMKGNVYGGGRGLDKDHQGNTSPTAGVVDGNTKVDILNGAIWRSVFGGGNESVVKGQKLVNVVDGLIHADVHGGSNAVPSNEAAWAHAGLKTVNIRGGHVMGDVYGCSHSSNDGVVAQGGESAKKWTSFVNINGGTIDGNVHGAGYAGLVNGSVCVNIGKDAILNAPNHTYNVNYNKPHTGSWGQTGITPVEPTVSKLVIGGSVYGGSDFYGTQTENDWLNYDLTGYSLIFIDGTGYNTTDGETATNYMNIGGGLFGSGTHTESGALGRHILLKEYGTRTPAGNGEMTSATRTLTTIQRAGNVIIDHANVNLSGLTDISSTTNVNKYGVMRVSDTLAVINASSIVLGSATQGGYAHMDSIYTVQSLNLASSTASIYNHNLNELNKHSWYWLGIKDEDNAAKLYNINGTGENAQVVGNALTYAQENVVLYNDTSKLWVRYHDMKDDDTEYKQYYGELLGFFRMRGDYYHPTLKDDESFAYARPKITNDHEFDDDNEADGGWLSYNTGFNYFTDLGYEFTHTQQYPYINVLDYTRGDREDYRMWVDKSRKRRWYVDGTRGWGRDDKKKYRDQAGLFPDKPKKTLYGKDADNKGTGIVNEEYTAGDQLYLNYSHKEDVIYVVGALSAEDEKEMLRDSTYLDDQKRYPLKLYRYPGGHPMSNDSIDFGGRKTPVWGVPNGNEVEYKLTHAGPGANYGAMLNVQAGAQIEMRGVEMDGLYAFDDDDKELHMIPTDYVADSINFHQDQVTMPLAVTHENSMLGLRKFTVLKRGYNSTNADVWYTDSDYKPAAGIYHGGAIFVDSLAIVNVYGLDSITIVDNKQYLKIGDEDADVIESNVYLPTFVTHLYIREAVAPKTRIGVTSPKRNKESNYVYNTFSPVAEVDVSPAQNNQIAHDVWTNNNFYDDLNWFFVNGHSDQDESTKRTTYFENFSGDPSNTVYFGWTWANVVRKMPENGYVVSGTNISISSEYGLAWLISEVNGMNRQPASSLEGKTVSLATAQTGDIKDIYDMQQYVWVPVGDPSKASFAGTFDGNGHLLTNLYVEYLGKGDKKYKLNDYGMFGSVSGKVDRTFLVSGEIRPVHTIDIDEEETETYNIGGLVGTLGGSKAMVSNSEAAMEIIGTQKEDLNIVAGGLVGQITSGEVHSSMAASNVTVGAMDDDPVKNATMGGLVGKATSGKINNSFVHAGLSIDGTATDDVVIGGLLGENGSATMKNCYVASITPENIGESVYDSIVGVNPTNNISNVDYCYVMTGYQGTRVGDHCGYYAPVITSDELGYMYADNRVKVGNSIDTTMFVLLNAWVDDNNTNHKYARWARPGLSEINGDLPVLLLSEFDGNLVHQGGFRSMGTYLGNSVFQYGGPARDRVEVDAALARTRAIPSDEDYLFIYGDVNEVNVELDKITQGKVSIYEHAAILSAGSLSEYNSTYVGVTFDNSRRHALSTPGVNGLGMQDLPRDWHMFSTPLSNVPLGFDYVFVDDNNTHVNTNVNTYVADTYYNNDRYYNSPWKNMDTEFTWLNGGNKGDKRYWMKEYIDADGYFPTQRGALFSDSDNNPLQSEIENLFIEGSDEFPGYDENNNPRNRYPYGMDFFTWYEPQYHWVNFKRNGPNHWHSDEPHEHLEYFGSAKNVNEETLIKGRGYMAAISIPTFLQSHGALNSEVASIKLTNEGAYCTGWNLVGNPFHGYLDFNKFANDNNLGIDAFYYIYDADGYTPGAPESAFLVYPREGSKNGAYAGQYLHPHQAFFVLSKSDGGNLKFYETTIVSRSNLGELGNDGHFRGDDWHPEYPLVNLFLSSDQGCSDITVIEFERPEWGGAMKLPELRNGNGMFYGYHDHEKYAALFAKEGTQRVPLWFEAKEDDFYTIKWNTANGDFSSLYLIDNLKGIQYDMLANDAYTFEGHKNDYYSRFYIVFNVTDVEEYTEHSFVFFDGSQWVVTGEGELDFIDLQGRVLWHGKLSGGQSRLSFPVVAKGMYLLRLVNSNETKVQKIIVE